MDGVHTGHADLEAVAGRTKVYAPMPKPRVAGADPYQPKPTDSPAIAGWRSRMKTSRALNVYRQRAATAECVTAQARKRGLGRVLARGIQKVRAVALWSALTRNLKRMLSLGSMSLASA